MTAFIQKALTAAVTSDISVSKINSVSITVLCVIGSFKFYWKTFSF